MSYSQCFCSLDFKHSYNAISYLSNDSYVDMQSMHRSTWKIRSFRPVGVMKSEALHHFQALFLTTIDKILNQNSWNMHVLGILKWTAQFMQICVYPTMALYNYSTHRISSTSTNLQPHIQVEIFNFQVWPPKKIDQISHF